MIRNRRSDNESEKETKREISVHHSKARRIVNIKIPTTLGQTFGYDHHRYPSAGLFMGQKKGEIRTISSPLRSVISAVKIITA